MNRRGFIKTLIILGGGALATYYGNKYVKSNGTPDLAYLDQNHELVADLAEIIIPKTDTPGAKEALVHEFIIRKIKNTDDVKIKNNFIDGLKEIQEYSLNEYNLTFSKLNRNLQIEVLSHFRDEDLNFSGNLGKVKNKIMGKSFFLILKEYTCIGYCTSMLGVTKGLAYEAIPSRYVACSKYSSGQRSWATK